ncbi:MobF family relaxase [Aldersonia kunmingensis]|uniref:MobF family relaxase n=1 Tax=Aldersonia kunmingensis TaxID=408066 RepID=UPI000835D2D7|nr:MobF family relaxase [Aldersonia kunmingensis]
MSLHKLTAGDGYEYLTRQVAAADATDLGRTSLGDYYAEKGESPGVWLGSGLAGLDRDGRYGITAGDRVCEEQMKALFGEGLHPNADEILGAAIAADRTEQVALSLTKLGRPFHVYTGATRFRVAVAQRFQAFNEEVGAKWNAPIHPEIRAAIRTQVSREFFEKEYGRPPLDDREFSGWMARLSRQQTDAVAGYDCTFSPVKSVSTLWALAPRSVSDTIAQCHDAAVADALRFLETHAAYTRLGTDGIAQVDTDGLIAAAFVHRDSRAGDPDLHTHLVVSNKVRTTTPDGQSRWLALDARPLHKLTVAASEVYNTRLEAHLTDRLAIRFEERPNGDRRKQPVREIVGIDPQLNAAWSGRRAAIEHRIGQLARDFQRDHGREPTPIEAVALAQTANLQTRGAKHEPRSLAEQRASWRTDAENLLGGPDQVAAMLADTLTHPIPTVRHIDDAWIAAQADRIVDAVSTRRARWQPNHLRAEAERRLRSTGIAVRELDSVATRLVDAACDPRRSVALRSPVEASDALTPAALRRRNGTPVYTTAGTDLYTSQDILAAETRLLIAAKRGGGAVARDLDVELALLESAANGRELNTGPATLVRELATSGRRLQLALAPAGTGKTTAMRTLARAWTNTPGRTVLGLAPTAAAAAVLREEINTSTDNLAKLNHLIYSQAHADPASMPPEIRTRARDIGDGLLPATALPGWFTMIGAGTLVVVDEAGMAGTRELDLAVSYLLDRGADVRLVADDRQLAAISAGGILRDIADTTGALTLSHVVRFTDPAEGPASLALRSGDDTALGFYADQGRLHTGSTVTITDAGYEAWAHDQAAGHDSVMLAYTRDTVNELNARARTDRLAAQASELGRGRLNRLRRRLARDTTDREVTLADGLCASAGDIVCTRRNDRRLAITATDWVRNGDRWYVENVEKDGSLRVRNVELQRIVTLPADYVREHTTLGYARTIHAAQGLTADTCHTILTGTETRELLYVAATRGRHANHIYLPTASDGDLHTVMTADGLRPPAGIDLLRDILSRDAAEPSAHTTQRQLADPRALLRHAAGTYHDAIGAGAEHLLGTDYMNKIDCAAGILVPGVTEEAAWPVLRRHLATLAVDDHNPIEMLADAMKEADLHGARDAAAVLDSRLDPTGQHSHRSGPLPWLPTVPDSLTDHPDWGTYLTTRAVEVQTYARQVSAMSVDWTPTTAPLWARQFVGENDRLLTDLAVFRAARGIPDHDRRPIGPSEYAAAPWREQHRLRELAASVGADPAAAAARWQPLADALDPHLTRDPFWPDLADRLDHLARAGIDVTTLTRTAVGDAALPDELPAAALWWRLARTLDPGALQADSGTVAIRPEWTRDLADAIGERSANRVIADPAWPTLVAAIESARHTPWAPRELLDTANDLLLTGQDHSPLRSAELAAALAVRIEVLIRETANYTDSTLPDQPPMTIEEEEQLLAYTAPQFQQHDTTAMAAAYGRSATATDPDGLDVPLPDEPPADDENPPPPDSELAPDDRRPDDLVQPLTSLGVPATAEPPFPHAVARIEAAHRLATEARREAIAFASALEAGTTPALQDAASQLHRKHAAHNLQRPYRDAAIDAHHEWIQLERAAETTAARLSELTRHSSHESADPSAAAARGLARLTADARHLLALADLAQTAAEASINELRSASGDHSIVTDRDLQRAQQEAEQIDKNSLDRLRRTVTDAETVLHSTEILELRPTDAAVNITRARGLQQDTPDTLDVSSSRSTTRHRHPSPPPPPPPTHGGPNLHL